MVLLSKWHAKSEYVYRNMPLGRHFHGKNPLVGPIRPTCKHLDQQCF